MLSTKVGAKEAAQITFAQEGEAVLRQIQALRRVGVSEQDILEQLLAAKISQGEAEALLAGRVPEIRIGD